MCGPDKLHFFCRRLPEELFDTLINTFCRQPISLPEQILRPLLNVPIRQTKDLGSHTGDTGLRQRLEYRRAEPAHLAAFFNRHDIPNPFRHIHDQFLIERLHKPAINDRRRDAFFAESLRGLHRLPYGDPDRHDRHICPILQQLAFPDGERVRSRIHLDAQAHSTRIPD